MYRTRSFHKEGLFSEVLFGPVKDYSCSCGRVHGIENEGVTCKNCGVTCGPSDSRRTTFGKIDIPDNLTIVNPALLDMLDRVDIPIKKLKLSKLISGRQTISYDCNADTYLIGTRTDDGYIYGPEVFKENLVPYLVLKSDEFFEFYNKYQDYLFIKYIPVIPPDTRPLMQSANDEKQFFSDEINEKYGNILRQLTDIEYSPFIFQSTQTILQNRVTSLFDTLLSKFEKKTGFLRSSLLGKRIDYSGRAVITVDGYELPLGYCKVPFYIAKELFKPQLLRLLSEKLDKTSLEILKDWDKPYLRESTMEILKKIVVGKYVFLNRQPTLHRPSFQSVKVYDVIWDDVIVIHPLITESYNADKHPSLSAMVVIPYKISGELLEKFE